MWGAGFGSGLWGALDREAQDFQQRRKARKEQERQKRLAEEEQLRQQELANQRAMLMAATENQDASPALASLDAAGGTALGFPVSNVLSMALPNLFNEAGVGAPTVGNILNAQRNIDATEALKEKERKAQNESETKERNDTKWNHELWKMQKEIQQVQEAEAMKPILEQQKAEAEALKAKMAAETHAANLREINSRANYHNAMAGYYKNDKNKGANAKTQPAQISEDEQKFIDLDKNYDSQLKQIDKDISDSQRDASIYNSSGSFTEAENEKKKQIELIKRRNELKKQKQENAKYYSEWKSRSNNKKPVSGKSLIEHSRKTVSDVMNKVYETEKADRKDIIMAGKRKRQSKLEAEEMTNKNRVLKEKLIKNPSNKEPKSDYTIDVWGNPIKKSRRIIETS